MNGNPGEQELTKYEVTLPFTGEKVTVMSSSPIRAGVAGVFRLGLDWVKYIKSEDRNAYVNIFNTEEQSHSPVRISDLVARADESFKEMVTVCEELFEDMRLSFDDVVDWLKHQDDYMELGQIAA